jgi:type IV pilus assembly protein PilA
MKSIRNSKGFSLVELMVVVAIIGILAAIAVPNFQKFAAKSKQSEAKSNLSAIYSAERAFNSEFQTYNGGFGAIGYAPTGNLRYDHGFTANIALPSNHPLFPTTPTPTDFSTTIAAVCGAAGTFTLNCSHIGPSIALVPATTLTNTTFKATAIGDLAGLQKDEWTIDQNKTLANPVNGIM